MKSKIQIRKPRTLMAIPLAFALLLVAGLSTALAQSPITAEVDRAALSTDEALLLTVTINTSSALSMPRPLLPPLEGFAILGSSSSSQISIVNGDIRSVAIYTYRLQPYQAGDLLIEAVSVNLGGQLYTSQPIPIHVTQGGGAPASPAAPGPSTGQPAIISAELNGQDLFVEAEVDNSNPYVGEEVIYTFRFYQAVNLWDQPQFEGPAFTGFWSENQTDQQEYRIQAAGRIYNVTEVRTILFPSVLGPVTIEPARLMIPGGFFMSGRTLQSKPIELTVRPLPPDAPPGFAGAVGQFGLEATVDATEGRVNEPLAWQVTLSGRGNLKAVPDPTWPETADWRTFESQTATNSEVRDGHLMGNRVYERLLIPTRNGEFTIPALEYVYFDPDTGQYRTTRTEPITVSIAPGEPGSAAGQPQTGSNLVDGTALTIEQASTDIRHLKPVPAELGLADQPVTQSGLYWAAWFFPLLGAVGYFAWQRRQRYREINQGLVRSSQARRKARKALKRAGGSEWAQAGQILTTYLADKLDRPVVGLTHQALAKVLAENRVSADLVERVEVLLDSSALGRFAPNADSQDLARSLLNEVDVLINALEKAL